MLQRFGWVSNTCFRSAFDDPRIIEKILITATSLSYSEGRIVARTGMACKVYVWRQAVFRFEEEAKR